ncbi:MAG TPA: acetolactate synthase small subunit [Chloroflexi bacterium]|jgi:acetolactate synthase-1/3 small subunit|nr:acetolactate synthase small subunit [Chloroflexota bacterium]
MSAISPNGAYSRRTLVVLMEDRPGVLSHVTSLFRRRNYNIESLTVGHSETPGISRMTVVVHGDDAVVEQVIKQLYKLINVTKVSDITDDAAVIRELAMIKIHATSSTRGEVKQLVDIFRAQIIDVSHESMTVEITGTEDKVDSLIEILRPFGIKELTRTGRIAMVRGLVHTNGVH